MNYDIPGWVNKVMLMLAYCLGIYPVLATALSVDMGDPLVMFILGFVPLAFVYYILEGKA